MTSRVFSLLFALALALTAALIPVAVVSTVDDRSGDCAVVEAGASAESIEFAWVDADPIRPAENTGADSFFSESDEDDDDDKDDDLDLPRPFDLRPVARLSERWSHQGQLQDTSSCATFQAPRSPPVV